MKERRKGRWNEGKKERASTTEGTETKEKTDPHPAPKRFKRILGWIALLSIGWGAYPLHKENK